jgi:hypothetical protein
VPVVVRLKAESRADIDLLSRLPVPGARGPVPLSNVATLTLESGPAQIDRYDRLRNVNLEVELNGQPLGEVEKSAMALPSLRTLPPGVTQSVRGDAESMNELFASFGLAMLTGVICIYVVLVLLLKDFIQPVTILGALVLSIPGAFLALWVTQTALSMPSMIGLIMLMGIATKNSILLVDYVLLARRDHGLGRLEAVIDACRKRARPIVMTTIAMAAGMMPIALGLGRRPELPRADGHRRDRRPDHLDLPQPAGHSGAVHGRRRCRAGGGALVDARAQAACGVGHRDGVDMNLSPKLTRRAATFVLLASAALARAADGRAYDTLDFDWTDPQRASARCRCACTCRQSAAATALPLVVFSHGIGGSRQGYSYLGRHWASQGYASLHLQHVGSDRNLWFGNPSSAWSGACRAPRRTARRSTA